MQELNIWHIDTEIDRLERCIIVLEKRMRRVEIIRGKEVKVPISPKDVQNCRILKSKLNTLKKN